MNRVSFQKNLAGISRWMLPLAAATLSACALLTPQPPAPKPAKLQKPAVNADALQKERARLALQKATASSNEYSACVMFATSTHRSGNSSPNDVATAASANCAPKLDDYEQGMAAYYEDAPAKPATASGNARERAHESRVELEQTTRDAAMRSLSKAN